jgi:hypothetical protein
MGYVVNFSTTAISEIYFFGRSLYCYPATNDIFVQGEAVTVVQLKCCFVFMKATYPYPTRYEDWLSGWYKTPASLFLRYVLDHNLKWLTYEKGTVTANIDSNTLQIACQDGVSRALPVLYKGLTGKASFFKPDDTVLVYSETEVLNRVVIGYACTLPPAEFDFSIDGNFFSNTGAYGWGSPITTPGAENTVYCSLGIERFDYDYTIDHVKLDFSPSPFPNPIGGDIGYFPAAGYYARIANAYEDLVFGDLAFDIIDPMRLVLCTDDQLYKDNGNIYYSGYVDQAILTGSSVSMTLSWIWGDTPKTAVLQNLVQENNSMGWTLLKDTRYNICMCHISEAITRKSYDWYWSIFRDAWWRPAAGHSDIGYFYEPARSYDKFQGRIILP